MIDFLNMGGYALFVWGAYAVATLLVSVLYISSVKALKAVQSTSEVSLKTKEATGTLREKSLA
jgi:heme exporter protein CcmD